ncbi:hypothetical protein Thi970DRAFT_04169 [Thiorhodovibrio frisius]|uniref:Uncharacterized protein n=1 Tax=Thiorhodovibrio frisius TaxID=631362 RepID=H8Z5C1_9GAMM|nr:hypothetical protein Thi970DRAFT_04169 [Thiorhodovibrio frisius]WPL21273.1 hypothetical protein Thiofri_01385 [Thiorhodovibrio frisius]
MISAFRLNELITATEFCPKSRCNTLLRHIRQGNADYPVYKNQGLDLSAT